MYATHKCSFQEGCLSGRYENQNRIRIFRSDRSRPLCPYSTCRLIKSILQLYKRNDRELNPSIKIKLHTFEFNNFSITLLLHYCVNYETTNY